MLVWCALGGGGGGGKAACKRLAPWHTREEKEKLQEDVEGGQVGVA